MWFSLNYNNNNATIGKQIIFGASNKLIIGQQNFKLKARILICFIPLLICKYTKVFLTAIINNFFKFCDLLYSCVIADVVFSIKITWYDEFVLKEQTTIVYSFKIFVKNISYITTLEIH